MVVYWTHGVGFETTNDVQSPAVIHDDHKLEEEAGEVGRHRDTGPHSVQFTFLFQVTTGGEHQENCQSGRGKHGKDRSPVTPDQRDLKVDTRLDVTDQSRRRDEEEYHGISRRTACSWHGTLALRSPS